MTSLLSLLIAEMLQLWEDPRAKILFSGAQRLRRRLLDLANFCLQPQISIARRLKLLRTIDGDFRTAEMLIFLFDNCPGQVTIYIL
jgi:hypothetical protein